MVTTRTGGGLQKDGHGKIASKSVLDCPLNRIVYKGGGGAQREGFEYAPHDPAPCWRSGVYPTGPSGPMTTTTEPPPAALTRACRWDCTGDTIAVTRAGETVKDSCAVTPAMRCISRDGSWVWSSCYGSMLPFTSQGFLSSYLFSCVFQDSCSQRNPKGRPEIGSFCRTLCSVANGGPPAPPPWTKLPQEPGSASPQVGYHGRDVDSICEDLYKAAVTLLKNKIREQNKEKVRKKAREVVLKALCGEGNSSDFEEFLDSGALADQEVVLEVPKKPAPAQGQQMEEFVRHLQGVQKQSTQQRMTVSEALKVSEEIEMEKLLDDEKVAQEVRLPSFCFGGLGVQVIGRMASRHAGEAMLEAGRSFMDPISCWFFILSKIAP